MAFGFGESAMTLLTTVFGVTAGLPISLHISSIFAWNLSSFVTVVPKKPYHSLVPSSIPNLKQKKSKKSQKSHQWANGARWSLSRPQRVRKSPERLMNEALPTLRRIIFREHHRYHRHSSLMCTVATDSSASARSFAVPRTRHRKQKFSDSIN